MRKGELSRQRLIEGLFYCLGEYGIEATTFQKVADHCGVSQTLVVKVFKNREQMLWTAFDELIKEAVAMTENSVSQATSSFESLEDYFRISIKIFKQRPQTARIYVLLYYLSTVNETYLKFNTRLKEVAVDRISLILKTGMENGEFHFSEDTQHVAKMIHSSLTGLLINSASEISNYDVNSLSQSFLAQLKPNL